MDRRMMISQMMKKATVVLAILSALFVFTNAAQAATKITYLIHDSLGSPVAATDGQGNVLWRETYAPFGQKVVNPAAATEERVGYTGKLHDNDTGLSYLNARYYDPVVGRFMAIDPVGPLDAGVEHLNRYVYVYNNPYKYTDPTGLIGNTVGDDDDPKMSGIGGGGVSLSETMPGISLGRGTTAPSTAVTGVNKNVTDVVSTRTSPIEAQKPIGFTKGVKELTPQQQKAIRSLEKQIAKHEKKVQDFKDNPTVRPGMENLPKEVIQKQQQRRIQHLETEINTFKNNIDKIMRGEIDS